jgi:predicted component of type VI protein secretion system
LSKLVLFLADGSVLDVPLQRDRMTIGRRADNDVCLPNLAVSGEHAAVVTILADSFLEDLGSTNGTLVNGTPISKHFLRDGDQIDVGRHMLVYCVDEDAVLTPPDIGRGPGRGAVGDLGQQVESAKPFVRTARDVKGSTMRRERAAENAAAALALETTAITRGVPSAAARPTAAAPPAAAPSLAPAPARRVSPPTPPVEAIKLITGPNAGRVVPLTKEETTIGRAGVQVALIRRLGATCELKQVEGERPPIVNGKAMEADVVVLMPGDRIEIAGTTLDYLGLPQTVDPS